ncbi:MAG: DNA-binding protein [Bacteroidetes bacterium RIFOXYA2_FULL_33_7]|nr:MAG: DNA-binding protein [Bacteroidetes bacterium GWA2_32_17]OFY75825.1 MAG: DNA-binding protein [Bacteroidetes bacterium RIFOXYA12_FULL_33_9]OFY89455.1 MAG: DNA-binding protein [Bacteroidetes bacterium RIFOXYA2_FULL_33_7]HBX52869.1 DNA-binding protein [Bacteroidales bacterium]
MENNQIDIKNKLDEGLTFKISRFKEQIKKTKPHKHDEYNELIFLSDGEGFHCIESEKFMVSTPEFYFLKPGQLHFWQFTSIPKGFVIIFKDKEFNGVNENLLIDLLRKLTDITRLEIQSDKYPSHILEDIFNEYQLNTQYSKEIIHGLLKALFGKLLQIKVVKPTNSNQPQPVYERFKQLLVKECPRLHKVNEFADLLNTTPQNLNIICRKQTGKSASEIISNQILLEAKRYILHTDNTINEIAEILSFTDTSNFVKFFKRHENITPIQFRSKYFQ